MQFKKLNLLKAVLCFGMALAPAACGRVSEPAAKEALEESAERNGDIVVLYTSDIHCSVDKGFGFVGLQQIRETMEEHGVTTLLVDDGDAIQGDVVGILTKGSAIVKLMNDVGYDVAIPGNHEFDYGIDRFLELTEEAEFPYISCNLTKNGELVLEPYVIREAAGRQIAFIGATTPKTMTSSSPEHFKDESGEIPYDFLYDETGELLFDTIQKYVDEVRAKGADYVVLMSHIGKDEVTAPYNFQTVIEHTTGIDVILDGHSHDTDQVTMNNKAGKPVIRSACGTMLQAIGYMRISGEDGSIKCGLFQWNNDEPLDELLGISNQMSEPVQKTRDDLNDILSTPIAHSSVDLVINDPESKTSSGAPKRIVRLQETNLADLISDAFRIETGAEIGLINGGGIRAELSAGDITYGDVVEIMPFSNDICVVEVTGQQILDALEWGSRALPGESGSLLHPSGLTYAVSADQKSYCTVDDEGSFASVDGPYRVHDVKVNGEPLDLNRKYTVAGLDYSMKYGGGGFLMFHGEDVILDEVKVDNQVLIDYIKDELNGEIGEAYANPYGEGRLIITGTENSE